MPRVPKKNIEPILVDVKGPAAPHRKAIGKPEVSLAHHAGTAVPLRAGRSRRASKFFAAFAAISAVLTLGLGAALVAGSRSMRETIAERGESVAGNFSKSIEALRALDPGTAARYLEENQRELSALERWLGGNGRATLAGALGEAVPTVGNAAKLLKEVVAANGDLLALAATLNRLRAEGVKSFMGDGTVLLNALEEVQAKLRALVTRAQAIKNATSELKSLAGYFETLDAFVGERYLTWSADLYALDEFLTELRALLGSETDRHLLVMFQNPSEIRPGGGFLGSYADLVVRKGAMQKLDVRDIYDPDGQLVRGYRAPEAFGDWTDWKARDANWFFDFPTSAEAVMTLLEASKMYEDYGVQFEAAIAVNIKVIETLLARTGPVTLADYGLTLTEENFLREVQREVEQGEDKAMGAPKRILQTVAPILLSRMGELGSEDVAELLGALGDHVARRDLMFYAREPKLAHFFQESGSDGAVSALPSDFWGNYAAVVNANIDGKKSDAVITQEVTIYTDVATDGSSLTDLAVTRIHRGDREKELFWRATNRNYLQIYAPPSAELILMKGNDPAPRGTALTDREKENLYPAEKIIEGTKKFLSGFQAWSAEAFGKRVFATWFNLPAGKSRTLEVRYQVPGKPGVAPKVGDRYTFIYERQSGVPTALSLTVTAPVGFTWKETETPRFTYEASDIPGRLVLPLTLSK